MYNKFCKECEAFSRGYQYCYNCYKEIIAKEEYDEDEDYEDYEDYEDDDNNDEEAAQVKPANQLSQKELMAAYQPRKLLTKNEWNNYLTLRKVAAVKGYIVCPKVRLLDLVEPKKGAAKWKTLFYKVQSKHVDFVICDIDMNVKLIIELDDSSHDREDRKERDKFVDVILRSTGYKIEHVPKIDYRILDLV